MEFFDNAEQSTLFTAIVRYCNYQERCHQEVRNKLYELGAKTPEIEQLIALLIEKNLLNEERYARSFARGKFNLKKWGRQKIVQQLKLHKISDFCIRKALQEIDPEAYHDTLVRLAERKWEELAGERNLFIRKNKTWRYLVQKGYEADLVQDVIGELVK
jgi:regulatory protein